MESTRPMNHRGGRWASLVRFVSAGVAAGLLAVGAPIAASATDEAPEAQLTAGQVQQRADALAEKYTEVGQLLSADDADFVRTYLMADTGVSRSASGTPTARAAQAAAGTTVKATGKGGGQQGWLGGTMSHKLSGAFSLDNSYSVRLAASGTKGITKTKVCAHVVAYGVAGQGGIGVVYTDNPCESAKKSYYSLSLSKRFSAYAVAITITSDATFYYSGGSFQVHS